MRLSSLLKGFLYQILQGDENVEITKLVQDSRKVECGAAFVCIRGGTDDGHQFIEDAAALGAAAIVVDEKSKIRDFTDNITIIRVWDTRAALAKMAAAYYCWPAEHMKIIGITGTKGKTTTAYMIFHILREAGYQTGLIGTIEVYDGKKSIPAENTTPDALCLHRFLRKMRENGCVFVVMEVSSQALMLHRTDGIIFDTAVFTNLGTDHISELEHRNFEEYKSCKAKLFNQCRHAVLNGNDPYWREMLQDAECSYNLFGHADEGNLKITDKQNCVSVEEKLIRGDDFLGAQFSITSKCKGEFLLKLPGMINVENALAAISVAYRYDICKEQIRKGLEKTRVRGRCELLPAGQGSFVIIDYAHNAMSLEKILLTLREYRPKRITCIFGCGGGRSNMRRKEMGAVSAKYADLTIITSDNPRYEDPGKILKGIENGICTSGGKYIMIEDRKRAIGYAIRNRKPGEYILIAGKGHENYQEIRGIKYPMNDREIAEGAIDVCRYNH